MSTEQISLSQDQLIALIAAECEIWKATREAILKLDELLHEARARRELLTLAVRSHTTAAEFERWAQAQRAIIDPAPLTETDFSSTVGSSTLTSRSMHDAS